ncbi:MAG: lipase family protein [Candidatus Amoebophilus sp.]
MNFNSFQRFVARILLVSLCLQSCGGGLDNNPLIPKQEEQVASIQTNAQAILPTNIQPLSVQVLTAQGGHAVNFYMEAGELKSDVMVNASQGFSKTYEGLSVTLEQGAELANLSRLNTKSQQRRIHLHLAQAGKPAKIVIYKGAGLVGGMEGDDEAEPMDEECIEQEGQVEMIEVQEEAEGEEDVSLEERNCSQLQTMPSERAKELPIFQKPLKAKQGSQEIYEIEGRRFKCQNVSGEGMDCFFNAAGLEREEQIARLKEYKDNKTVRVMIANDIVSAVSDPQEVEGLHKSIKSAIGFDFYKFQQTRIDDLVVERNNLLSKQNEDSEKTDLKLLPKGLQRETIEQKYAVYLNALKEKAGKPEAYNAFVDNFIGKSKMVGLVNNVQVPGNYTSIDAIAYINNLGIKVYRPVQAKDSDGNVRIMKGKLDLIHEFIPENATRIVYLYHSGVHFQTLIPFPHEEPSAEVMESENVPCQQNKRRLQRYDSSVSSLKGELNQRLMELSLKSQQVDERSSMEVEEEHIDKPKRKRKLIDDKEKREKENEKQEVEKKRKSYGTPKRDPEAKYNYIRGKHYYEEGKKEKGIEYLKRAKKAGNLKATQYLDQIQLQELQNSLKVPEIASKVFASIDQINCEQIESEIHTIDDDIKQNTEDKISDPELDRTKRQELEELQERLENIQGTAKDVSKSVEWKKNATIPVVESEDELQHLAERAVDAVYQELNKSIVMNDNGSSPSSSAEASTHQSSDINEEMQPQIRTNKEIDEEEMNTFLSTIADKNESSLTPEEREKLDNVSLFLQQEMGEISNIAYGEVEKPLIVLMGDTGAGKSTIADWLTGKKMFSIQDPDFASSDPIDNKFHFILSDTQNSTYDVSSRIAPGVKSKTITPELWPAKGEWVYADCPGFNDTRGPLQKIKNALYIQALFKHDNLVKFLLVMEPDSLTGVRGQGVVKALTNLKNMFKDPYKLRNSISLVITKHIKDVHNDIDTTKKVLKRIADERKDEALKVLLNDLAERRNGVTLFSRPLELGLYQNNEEEPESIPILTYEHQPLLKQGNEEKALVLESIKSTGFLSLNFGQDVKLSLPNDAKLLLEKMVANLKKDLTVLLKEHIAKKIETYFTEKIRNVKANVGALVDRCMQYYTPMALVFGLSKKAKEVLGETLSKNAISHNGTSLLYQMSSSWIAGATLTSEVTGVVLAASVAMPIVLLAAGISSMSVYYVRKKMWKEEVKKHFIERETEKIKPELYDFAIKLKKLNHDIFRINLLKNGKFLERINPTPLGISEIKKKAGLLDCICGISGNNRRQLSQTLWNDVFLEVNKHIVKKFFQTPYEFYENENAPEQMEQIPPPYIKYLTEKIKDNNKLSHIPEEFLKHLLTNYLNELSTPQNFSLTGSHLPPKKLETLIKAITFCRHIYTDITTRDFVVEQMIPTMTEKWKRIINNKNGIDRLYSNLLEISDNWAAVSRQPAIFVKRGKYSTKQVPSLPRKAQRPKFQADYTNCIEETNIFLQKILNRDPIDHKDLKHIVLAEQELNKVQQEIHMEFGWHFHNNNDKQIDASIPPFIDTTDKNKEYRLKAQSVIAASFLHKTQLPLRNANISILGVGFRNLKGLESIFSDILKPLIIYKDNPLACFTGQGEEVDHIAYIEKDETLKRKDKLVIVYSGSNSSKDWQANVKIGHTPFLNLSVHQGIGELFTKSASTYCNSLIEKIIHYYKNNPKPKEFKIITTGHSLGGALALLAAYHYKTTQIPYLCNTLGIDENKISVKTFTFGAPAIADETSQKSIEKVLGKNNIFRVCTINDPVVLLSEKLNWHVGRDVPLCNISNNEFNFLDLLGPHLAERYLCYLIALKKPFLSETHKELISILEKTKTIEMITMLKNGSLRTELPKSGEASIKTNIVSEGAGPSFSQNFEGTTTSNLLVSSSEREQEVYHPGV